jgi:hypothetical protein
MQIVRAGVASAPNCGAQSARLCGNPCRKSTGTPDPTSSYPMARPFVKVIT